MKVIHLSNTDSGGAVELHAAMLENGIDSHMIVNGYDRGDLPNVQKIKGLNKLKTRSSTIIAKIMVGETTQGRGMYTFPLWGADLNNYKLLKTADIIYLHFTAHSSFIGLGGLNNILKLGKPVFYITRDAWPVTGGCHTFFDCDKYLSKCKQCPVLTKKIINLASLQQRIKERIYSRFTNLYFIGISEWNKEFIQKSTLGKNKLTFKINNCIDTELFKPDNKKDARKILKITDDNYILGFGAASISDPRKGLTYLSKALNSLPENLKKRTLLITFGRNKEEYLGSYTRQVNLGLITNRHTLASFYNAVDLFVNPTLFEPFGNTAAESIACGTPVIGFNTGGLKDIIDHNENGYLAKPQDSDDLTNGIVNFLNRTDMEEISLKCREKAIKYFSRKVIFEEHKEMWEELGIKNY